MPDFSVTATSPSPIASPAVAAESAPSLSFHELLSDLNPLQYIPVIGTIYRSVTGDTIPESVRLIGSLVFSGLTGGPVGLATSAAMLALEKAIGIDPEKIGHDVLASIGIGSSESTASSPAATSTAGAVSDQPTVAAASPAAQPPTPAASPAAAPQHERAAEAWSPSQLTAYGVVRTAGGTLRRGNLVDSDVLNDLELARNRDGNSSGTALAAL